MTTCTHCNGKRIVTIEIPNMKGPSNNRYQSSITPFVTRNYQCGACSGTGRVPVECYRCGDTGLIEIADMWGGYDSTSPMACNCDTGKALVARTQARLAEERERELADPPPF